MLKRFKNIEDKTDRQLNETKDSQLGIKSIGYTIKEKLSEEAKNMLEKLHNQEKLINYQKLYLKGVNNSEYDFSDYRLLKEFFKVIYYRKITTEEAEAIQEEFDAVIGALGIYKPKKSKYYKRKEKRSINSQNFYDGRKMVIDTFKNKIFPLVPSGYTSDDDKGLRPGSSDSSFSTTVWSDKFDESDFTGDYLEECILAMLMILINCFLIQRNI